MSIGKKLNSALFFLIAIIAISTMINFSSYGKIENDLEEALDVRVAQVQLIEEIRFNLSMQGLYARALIIDPSEKNEQNLINYAEKLDENIHTLEQNALSGQTKQLAQAMNTFSEQLSASAEEVTASVNEIAIGAGKATESIEMIAAAMEEQSASMEQVNFVASAVTENSQQLQEEIQQFRV